MSKKLCVALLFTLSFSGLYAELPTWQEAQEAFYKATKPLRDSFKNISFSQSHAQKYPGRTAFAQFCYAHPLLTSAAVNMLGFSGLKRYTKRVLRNSKGTFGAKPYISTLLGTLGVSEWSHNYLRNTKTPHYMSPFVTRCTPECKNTNKELHDAVFNQ